MASIADLQKASKSRPACPSARGRETLNCPLLPSDDGESWGRDVTFRRLHVHDQIVLTGRVVEAIQALSVEGETKTAFLDRFAVPELDTPREREVFFENAWMLTMAVAEPKFEIHQAIEWLSNDELDGIPVSDAAQWMLFHARGLNEEQPGLEDVAPGLQTLRRLPFALQTIERAYLQGGDALELLLEGRVPESQKEMADFIGRWGGIISTVVVGVWKKQAEIEADVNASVFIVQLLKAMESLGMITRGDADEEED